MNEPVDSSQCHGGVGEDPVPCAERLVRGNKHGSSLISGTDELEQDAGLGLILGDIGEIVKDEQVELVELLDCAFEDEIAPCLLELLDEIRGSGKEDTVSVLDQGEANCGGEMALAAAWWAEEEQIGALAEPDISGDHGHDLCLRDHGDRLELERIKGLAWEKPGFGQMAFDPALVPFGQFMFAQGGEEARCWPPFLVGLLGELGPDELGCRQAQFVKQQGQLCGIDDGLLHAASPVMLVGAERVS